MLGSLVVANWVKLAGSHWWARASGQPPTANIPRLTPSESPSLAEAACWEHGFRDSKTRSKIGIFGPPKTHPEINRLPMKPPKNDEFSENEARSWWPTISSIILRFRESGVRFRRPASGVPSAGPTARHLPFTKNQLACGEAYDLRVDRTPQPLRLYNDNQGRRAASSGSEPSTVELGLDTGLEGLVMMLRFNG